MRLFGFINKYRLDVGALYFATAWVYLTFRQTQTDIYNVVVALSLSSWIVATYLFNKVCDYEEDLVSQPGEHAYSSERGWLALVALLLALAPLPLLHAVRAPLLLYVCLLPVGCLYSLPLVDGWRIKNVLFVKNLYAAVLGWYLPVVLFSHYGGLRHYHQSSLLWEMGCGLKILVIVLCIELLWDLRDIDGDRLACVMTVPVVFGETATRYLIYALLAWLAAFIWYTRTWVLLRLIIFIALITPLTSPRRPGWFFHLIAYGQMAVNLSFLMI